MKRNLLLILTLFVASLSNAEITVEDNQMWWGYFNESNADDLPYDGYIGSSGARTLDAAIHIPASEEIVGGSTIKAIRLWLGNDISAINSSMRVWISTSLPATGTVRATYKQTVAKTDIVGGLNEIELTTPFEVDYRDIYVGYTITTSKKAYPIMAYGTDMADGFFFRSSSGTNFGNWNDFYGSEYGRLALQILVEADSFPTNCVSVSDLGQNIVLKGTSTKFPITVTNKGLNPVKSISYTICSEGSEPSEESTKTYSSSPMTTNGSKTFTITFPGDEEARKCQKTITITKVNDEPNTSIKSSGTGFVINLAEKASVTPVIEEFTGTWCGWCPRGMTGMEKIHETYGDQVVQIAAHSGDVMAISAYSPIINKFCSGYPGSITDRQYEADPSFSSLKSTLTTAFKRVSPGSIELSAMWNSEANKAVTFTTKTKFNYSEEDGQYAIAYVLTEDGMTGTGSSWAQQNYYNGQSGDSSMSFWYTAGSSVSGLEFNHVAVEGWNVESGVDGSVNPIIEAGVEQEFSYTASISSNSLIQDKSKLKAIVLLIDRTSGKVVNAAQSDIADFTTGINTVSSKDNMPVARYSLDGRKLPSAEKGINIVHMSDGTVKKILVK